MIAWFAPTKVHTAALRGRLLNLGVAYECDGRLWSSGQRHVDGRLRNEIPDDLAIHE